MKAKLKDLELELWLRMRENDEITWTTRDGREVPINKMEESHLINTVNMIKNNKLKKYGYPQGLFGRYQEIKREYDPIANGDVGPGDGPDIDSNAFIL